MAFEDVEEQEVDVGKYWAPKNVKDSIEGNVYGFEKDQWGNKRIVLDLGDDENGEVILTTLPGHAHLKRFIPNLETGDYIRVELVKLLEPSEDDLAKDPNRSATRIYKVQKDPEKKIDYEPEE